MQFTIRNIMKVMRATSGRMFGRVAAGDGPAEELTPAQVRTLLTVYTTSEVDTLVNAKIGGSTGATDNRVLRADGVGGVTLQHSPVTIDDSGNVTGVASLTVSDAINTLGSAHTLAIGGTNTLRLTSGGLYPLANNVIDLGLAGAAFRDLTLTRNISCAAITASGTVTTGSVLRLGNTSQFLQASATHVYLSSYGGTGLAVQRLGFTNTIGIAPVVWFVPILAGTALELNSGTVGDRRDLTLRDITCAAITASDAVKTGLKLFSALPAASASTDCIFTVTDRSGRPLAKSDGTDWYNVFTGAVLT